MTVSPVSATSSSASNSAAFGLSFQSLLSIILTQLTYQDPLKPMDNFEFVSQLAQFAQLQQSQTLNTQVTNLLSAQSTMQATGLLGKTIDFTTTAGGPSQTGTVQTVSLSNGSVFVTAQTSGGGTVANIAISNITQIQQPGG